MMKGWDAKTGRFDKTLDGDSDGHTNWISYLTFVSEDTLASGSYDTTVKFWNTKTGEVNRTLDGHADTVRSLSFSPNSRTLASASDDQTIILWHVDKHGARRI